VYFIVVIVVVAAAFAVFVKILQLSSEFCVDVLRGVAGFHKIAF